MTYLKCKLLSVCTFVELLVKPELILFSYPTIRLFGDYNNTFGTNKAIQLGTPASHPPCCRLGLSCLYLTSRQSFILFYYGRINDYPLKMSFLHLCRKGLKVKNRGQNIVFCLFVFLGGQIGCKPE